MEAVRVWDKGQRPCSVFIMVIRKHLEFMMRPWGWAKGIRNPVFADFSIKQSSRKAALHLSAGQPGCYRPIPSVLAPHTHPGHCWKHASAWAKVLCCCFVFGICAPHGALYTHTHTEAGHMELVQNPECTSAVGT